jgi:hypothetical protein
MRSRGAGIWWVGRELANFEHAIWELRDDTYDHCPEWKDPEGSMIPMRPEELFEVLKLTPAQCEAAMAKLRAEDAINAAFEAARH